MAIPPGEGPVNECASREHDLAFFWEQMNFEHRFRVLEPSGQVNYTSVAIKWLGLAIREVFVGSPPSVSMPVAMIRTVGTVSIPVCTISTEL